MKIYAHNCKITWSARSFPFPVRQIWPSSIENKPCGPAFDTLSIRCPYALSP